MAAIYFMGGRSFTAKNGNTCFTVQILSQNRFGDWVIGKNTQNGWSPSIFVDSGVFKVIQDSGIKRGDAVNLITDLEGGITGITLDKEIPPLELWE